MQRVRMSLEYFKDFDWCPEVVTVAEEFSDAVKDELLVQSIPKDIVVHTVKALSKKWTSKIGLGSIALRSLIFYRKEVDRLLKNKKYHLIYFSTTQFPVCILGAYWKKKWNIPYVIDMQDPWHSDYYKDKPKYERPPKYWFSYNLNKMLEPIAMREVGGLISVSGAYIDTLKSRYHVLNSKPSAVITFGAYDRDLTVVVKNSDKLDSFIKRKDDIYNLAYVGRGGKDMHKALTIWFNAFKKGIETFPDIFNKFIINFIGTSYAPKGQGIPSILPLARELGLQDFVKEHTDRIPFYEGLKTLATADALLVPGSDDSSYTASKLYPYIQAKKPLIGIFHPMSSAITILEDCKAGEVLTLDVSEGEAFNVISQFIIKVFNGSYVNDTNWSNFEKYTAKEMTRNQVGLFNEVLGQA